MPAPFRLRTLLICLAGAAAGMGTAALFRTPAATSAGKPVSARSFQQDGPLVSQSARRAKSSLEAFRAAESPQARMEAALRLAENGTAEDIRALLDLDWKFPGDTSSSLAIAALLKRWLMLDPDAAVEYARVHEGKLLAKLIGNWSVADPEKAQAFALSLPAGTERAEAWAEICQASLHGEPGKTWDLLCRAPSFTSGVQEIMKKLITADPDDAIVRLEGDMPPELARSVRIGLSKELMKTDPDRAWAWIGTQSNSGELRGHALGAEFTKDPAHALALLASLGPEEQASRFSDRYSYGWKPKDIPALAAALQSEPGLSADTKKQLAGEFFGNAAWEDPAGTVSLLTLFPENEMPGRVTSLMNSWWRKDKAAGQEWLASLPIGPVRSAAEAAWDGLESASAAGPPVDRNSPEGITASLKKGEYFTDDDARLAKVTPEMLAEFPPEKDAYQKEEMLEGLAEQNPAAGAAWLQTWKMDTGAGEPGGMSESAQAKSRQIGRFTSTWAAQDPAAAASWVGQLPAGDLARNAAANVAMQYSRYAPAEARKWIDSLPPGPVRQAAEQGVGK